MYSSEYTSGFSGPAASHLAAPPLPRHEDNAGQAPTNFEDNPDELLEAGCAIHWHIDCVIPRRMLKKAVQQGRNERRGDGVRFGTLSF
jgi:hypothetical protein